MAGLDQAYTAQRKLLASLPAASTAANVTFGARIRADVQVDRDHLLKVGGYPDREVANDRTGTRGEVNASRPGLWTEFKALPPPRARSIDLRSAEGDWGFDWSSSVGNRFRLLLGRAGCAPTSSRTLNIAPVFPQQGRPTDFSPQIYNLG